MEWRSETEKGRNLKCAPWNYYCGIWCSSVQHQHQNYPTWGSAAPVIVGSLSLCSCRALFPGHIWPAAKQTPVDRGSLWGKNMQALTIWSWASTNWSGKGSRDWAHRLCLLHYYLKRTQNKSKHIADSEILATQIFEFKTTSDPLYFYFHFCFQDYHLFTTIKEVTTKSDLFKYASKCKNHCI